MIQEKVLHESPFPAMVLTPRFSVGSVILLCIAFFAAVALYRQAPPNAVAANAAATEFSSGRAMKHVRVIARQSHPIGSSEHAAVRDYILQELSSLGLETTVQKTTALNRRPGVPWLGGTVENLIARVNGTSDRKAVMLACHYDSVPTGPGASDDGSGVAALLETARSLKAGPPLQNDVLLLFTDGEEAGLLGSSAFVDEHPWAKQVAVVLNFEARGSRGPVLMFETSPDNFYLIKTLAQSVPHPQTNSLFYELYRRLPNDTDLTIFKQAGIPGLNFAFIDPATNYHTQLDNIENMDERSLQHQGLYALTLARALGNAQLSTARGDAVYFDLAGMFVIYYPVAWVLPITVLLIVVFAGIVVLGTRNDKLTIGGIALGALPSLLAIAGSWLLVSLVWRLVRVVHNQYDLMPTGETYNSRFYLFAFAALTLAFTSALYVVAAKRVSFQNLWAGALIWWLVLLVVTTLMLPGGSYLFMWPLGFSLPALAVTLVMKSDALKSVGAQASMLLGALTGVILFGPLIYLLFIGLTVSMSALVMVVLALLLTLFIPQNDLMRIRKAWLLPVGSLIVCGGFLLAGSLTAGFSRSHPLQDHLLYGTNSDTQQAMWVTSNAKPDAWTNQFFSQEMKRSSLPQLFPFSSREFLTSQAPFIALPAPNLELLSSNVENGVRRLRVRFTSPRQAAVVSLGVEANMPVQCTNINGKPISNKDDEQPKTNGNKWGIRYYAPPPEGVELTLETRSEQPLVFKVVDQSYGLPALPNSFKPRPENVIPAQGGTSDSTLVAKSFSF